ncbi:AMP-binding protein [Saccharopolyspora erythraea]|uniref:AMP-binding protein n=1 Tax=Saccharopolyspora erythraea TaxID=1836 RepID=UPI001BA721BB|nr:AMP-binding protein [Saccharopolyspora erythraea]QUH04775.1 AMP-binding protein [Saccharopolyspora erythraea]
MGVSQSWAATALETTIPSLFSRNTKEHPEHPALTEHRGGSRRTWTWGQAGAEVDTIAAGLRSLGLQRGQTMLTMMSNRAEHWLADVAATHLGAVPATVHGSHASDHVLYLARHSRARVVVVEGADQVGRWSSALREPTAIEHVVVMDREAVPAGEPRFLTWEALLSLGRRLLADDPGTVARQRESLTPDRPATILYTTERAREDKCVVLTHRNIGYAAAALERITGIPRHANTICYRPLTDAADRMLGMYSAIHSAAHVHLCADAARAAAALPELRPAAFFGAPRVWEELAADAESVAPHRMSTAQARRRLRARLGLGEVVWASSGSAPLEARVLELFASLGVDIRQSWGTAETSGFATANHAGASRPGTAGRGMPGVEVRIADDGEILVRGPVVCPGHLQPDGVIKPVTDADGWLRTGDAGSLDEDGFLVVTHRARPD